MPDVTFACLRFTLLAGQTIFEHPTASVKVDRRAPGARTTTAGALPTMVFFTFLSHHNHHPQTHTHGRQEIEERGTGAIEFVRKAGGGCWAYGTKYTVGKLLTLVASVNVVIINFGLKASTRRGGVVRTILFRVVFRRTVRLKPVSFLWFSGSCRGNLHCSAAAVNLTKRPPTSLPTFLSPTSPSCMVELPPPAVSERHTAPLCPSPPQFPDARPVNGRTCSGSSNAWACSRGTLP